VTAFETAAALPDVLIRPLVQLALAEDFGRSGDITSMALIPASQQGTCVIRARDAGVIAGLQAARLTCAEVDPTLGLEVLTADGTRVGKGDLVARLTGPVRSILMAERTVLNFMGRLSGVATLTAAYVAAVAGTRARIADTRKTTPGLRALEKQAVRLGGGLNHRFGLDDAILIKDNHIAACGSVSEALRRARAAVQHLRKIEIEVDTLAQLDEVLTGPPDVILLDNMDVPTLAEAVRRVAGRAVTEASGGVSLTTVASIAATGVDVISVGALTHSAPNFDLGLDWR
jgi:nicotinate-nucleotide pyrophosphorylase (carboxylating)